MEKYDQYVDGLVTYAVITFNDLCEEKKEDLREYKTSHILNTQKADLVAEWFDVYEVRPDESDLEDQARIRAERECDKLWWEVAL